MRYLTTRIVVCCFGLFIKSALSEEDWHFSGDNVALNRTATQMPGTFAPTSYLYYSANLAVDGNTDTNFLHNSCTHTLPRNGGPASWTVDLGQLYYVKGIHRIRLQAFRVIGLGSSVNTTLYNDEDPSHQHYKDEIIDIPLYGQLAYNSIRIQIPTRRFNRGGEGAFLTLCEVQIFGGLYPYGCNVVNNDIFSPSLYGEVQAGTGMTIGSKNSVGTVVLFNCRNQEYIVDGATAITCLDNGQYNDSVSSRCKSKGCQSTPILAYGHFNVVNRNINVGDQVTAQCSTGYSLHGDSYITCTHGGQWSGSPRCIKTTCGHPGSIENGFYSYLRVGGYKVNYTTPETGHFDYNQTLYVNCNKGYTYSGTVHLRQCNESGLWTGAQPNCTRITCQIPTSTSNIHFTYNKGRLLNNRIQYGETISAACTNGKYKLTGSPSRSCGANGVFNGIAPLCVAICQRPVTAHGSYSSNTSQFVKGQAITLVCNNGYESSSPNTKRVCQTDHSWSNSQTQCSPKQCIIPPIQNIRYNVTSANIDFPEAVTLECKKGFKMVIGSKTRTCQSNKSLSGLDPVCKEIFCSTIGLNQTENHYELIGRNIISTRIKYGDTVRATCIEGYERVAGSNTRKCIDDDRFNEAELLCYEKGGCTRQCQKDQTWSGDEPVCIDITESSSQKQTLSIPIIAGLATGCGLLVVIVVILVVVIFRRRRPLPKEQVTTDPYTSLDFSRPGTSSTENNYSEISNTNMALHVL